MHLCFLKTIFMVHRFFDVNSGQKLHLWRGETTDSSFSPLISSICSSGSAKLHPEDNVGYPSWIAASFSTGYCSLFDMRSGNIISSWQAHDGYVTKVILKIIGMKMILKNA